jgi:hypothetical protein
MSAERLVAKYPAQIAELARCPAELERAILFYRCDSRGVVAAILKPREPVDKDRAGLTRSNVSHYSAHDSFLSPLRGHLMRTLVVRHRNGASIVGARAVARRNPEHR